MFNTFIEQITNEIRLKEHNCSAINLYCDEAMRTFHIPSAPAIYPIYILVGVVFFSSGVALFLCVASRKLMVR